MRNISGKSCRKNQNTRYIQQPLSEICAINEILWKNMVQPYSHR